MRVYYRVLYLSYNAGVLDVPQPFWGTRKFTRVVKEGIINGFCHVPMNLFYKLRVDEKNASVIREMFGTWLVTTAERMVGKDFVFVPVPSKDAVIGAEGPFRASQALSEALAKVRRPPEICDILRFRETVPKASHGGPRSAEEIYPLLRVRGAIPDKPIILVDDVLTLGGHLRATKCKLQNRGADVRCGLVCGRTVQDTEGNPWTEGSEDFADYNPT